MSVFLKYFVEVLAKKYIDFSGRASRSEFWFFLLFSILLLSITLGIDVALYIYDLNPQFISDFSSSLPYFPLVTLLFVVLLLIPSIALIVRRIHDIGKSSIWVLLVFIPLIGFFAYLYFGLKKTQDNDKEDSSKSGIFGKILMLILTLLIAGVAALYYFMEDQFLAQLKSIKSQITQIVTQGNLEETNLITIHTPLLEKYTLERGNIRLCTPKKEKKNSAFSPIIAQGYSSDYSCVNEKCAISIDIEDPNVYPKSIEVYTTNAQGLCKKTNLKMNKPILNGYEALVTITPKLLTQLKVTDKSYKFIPKGTSNFKQIKHGDLEQLKLNYNKVQAQERLSIDTIPRVKLIFEKQKRKDDPYRELQIIKNEILQLKKKRQNLLERLD